MPSQSYYAFANYVGCFQGTAYGFETKPQTIFECLISQDTHTLQNASFYVSSTANYGVWGFLPVTDGVFIQDRPSKQLAEKRVNGIRMLTGNNADEVSKSLVFSRRERAHSSYLSIDKRAPDPFIRLGMDEPKLTYFNIGLSLCPTEHHH